MQKNNIDTPQLDKIKVSREKSQAIGDFLEWLSYEKGIFLAKDKPNSYDLEPAAVRTEVLLAQYFDIDLVEAEKERVKLLNFVREQIKNDEK